MIVNISGVIAEQGLAGMAAYGASKAAVRSFDEALAREARRRKIRVIDARPPHTETGLATRPIAGQAPRMPVGLDPCPGGRHDLYGDRRRPRRSAVGSVRFVTAVLVISAAASWAMVGLIWMVQVVHYPMLAEFSASSPGTAAVVHQRRISWVVGPLMAAEGVTALILLVDRPATIERDERLGRSFVAGRGAALDRPRPGATPQPIGAGHDRAVARRLISTNWVRTIAWTGRGVLLAACW